MNQFFAGFIIGLTLGTIIGIVVGIIIIHPETSGSIFTTKQTDSGNEEIHICFYKGLPAIMSKRYAVFEVKRNNDAEN